AGAFVATWLPKQYVGMSRFKYGDFDELARHLRYIDRTSRRLARSMFYAMSRYQAKLERKQALLFRFVDIGAELYAMSAACVRAHAMRQEGEEGAKAVRLADVFCRRSRRKVEQLFDEIFHNADNSTYRLAQEVLRGEHAWLEKGALPAIPEGASLAPRAESAGRAEPPEEKQATRLAAGG